MSNWEQVKDINLCATTGESNCVVCGQYKTGSGTCGHNCNLEGGDFCHACKEAWKHHQPVFRNCPQIIHPGETTCSNWLPKNVKAERRESKRREADHI